MTVEAAPSPSEKEPANTDPNDTDPNKTRFWREPLLWFALLGTALFFFDQITGDNAPKQILVTQALEQRLSDQWQGQMGRPPTAKELSGLTEQWIKEEIYAREAEAMGLDQNDTIIRRRLVQKLTFLTEDLATATAPDQDALRGFYEANLERYKQPARYDFEHRYFSSDRRTDANADAATVLAKLQAAPDDQELLRNSGDSFMLQMQFASRSERQIGDLFGREFGAALVTLPHNQWQGPVTSAYGEHLVRITGLQPARTQPFEEARSRLTTDFAQDRRELANQQYYERLRDDYEIARETLQSP